MTLKWTLRHCTYCNSPVCYVQLEHEDFEVLLLCIPCHDKREGRA